MSAKFKNIITGDIVDNDHIMDRIESGHIDGEDYRSYRSACCDSEVFIKRKSERAREHFSSTHTEKCPDQVREYYIDSKGNKKYLILNKLPSALNLNLFSIYDDDYNNDGDGKQGDSSKRSRKESDAVPRALYILEKIVGSSQSIDIRLGDETISSHEVIDCRGTNPKELIEKCNGKYVFAEVLGSWYGPEFTKSSGMMCIIIDTADGPINIFLSEKIKSRTKSSRLNIEGKVSGKRYVFFKLKKHVEGAYPSYNSLRLDIFDNGYESKKIYKLLGATIHCE